MEKGTGVFFGWCSGVSPPTCQSTIQRRAARTRSSYRVYLWARLFRLFPIVICVAAALGIIAGCGTGTSAGAGGVVVPGPSVGGNASGTDDQSADGDVTDAGDGGIIDGGITDGGGAADGSDGSPDSGDGSDDGSDMPSVDACISVNGRTFLAPGASATLSFVAGSFTWTLGGVQSVGTFECGGLTVTGTTIEGQVFSGRYDPQLDQVFWEGLVYRPVGP